MADREMHIEVTCEPSGDDWRCVVTVGDDPAATAHEVDVSAGELSSLAPGTGVERLVEESFRFLLEREPREAILRRFELPVIARYFPEYESEIGRRL